VRIWVDEQLSPVVAAWIVDQFAIAAISVRDLELESATDSEIYFAARRDDAIVMTKDQDFVRLLSQHGPPPRVLWIRLGNTSNDRLQVALQLHLDNALTSFAAGEALVEIRDALLIRAPQS